MKAEIDIKEDSHVISDPCRDDAHSHEHHDRDLFQKAVAEGMQAAKNGEFATKEEVRRVFAKYGVKC